MKVISGRVRNGRIELDGEPPPEGTAVTIIAADGEAFDLTPEEEAELDAALAEVSRGEVVDAADVLKQIRSV